MIWLTSLVAALSMASSNAPQLDLGASLIAVYQAIGQQTPTVQMPPPRMARLQLCWANALGSLDSCQKLRERLKDKVEGNDLRAQLANVKRETGIEGIDITYLLDITIPLETESHFMALSDEGISVNFTLIPHLTKEGQLALRYARIEYTKSQWQPDGLALSTCRLEPGRVKCISELRIQGDPKDLRQPAACRLSLMAGSLTDRRLSDADAK